MKKTILTLLASAMLLTQASLVPMNSVSAASKSDSVKEIEGKLVNGRVLVPVRSFYESLGAKVSWDSKEKMVFITLDDKVFSVRLDGTEVGIDGIIVGLTLDVPMTMIDNTNYLPFSFIGPIIGAKVSWDNQTKQATVVYKGQTVHVHGKADPTLKLPTRPTEQRLKELYAKVKVAANITDYAQKREQLSGYFTEPFIGRIIRNNGLTVYDQRYGDEFRDPTLFYSNESMYYAGYVQYAFINDEFLFGQLYRSISFKFVNGKWLVDDVDTYVVEPRP